MPEQTLTEKRRAEERAASEARKVQRAEDEKKIRSIISYYRHKKGLSEEDATAAAISSGELEHNEVQELVPTKKKQKRGLMSPHGQFDQVGD